MARRGIAGPALIELTLVVLIIAVLAIIFIMSKTSFVDAFYCTQDTDELRCESKVTGCAAGQEPYYFGYLGCGKGRMCCKVLPVTGPDGKPITANGGNQQEGSLAEVLKLPPTEIRVADPTTKSTISRGSSLTLYPDEERKLDITVDIPTCKDCLRWDVEEIYALSSGTRLNTGAQVIKVDNKPDSEQKIRDALKPIDKTYLTGQYIGQTITYTVVITPIQLVDKKEVKGTSQVFTMKFKVTSPIKVVGLTSNWEQKKTVTVSCTSDVKCSNITYIIQTDGVSCPPATAVDFSKAKSLPSKYCRVENGKLTQQCFDAFNSCTGVLDEQGDPAALQTQFAIQAAIRNGLIKQNYGLFDQFAQQEPTSSSYSCQIETGVDDGTYLSNPNDVRPIGATFDISRQVGVITLDRNFMSDRYACFYAQDAFVVSKRYVAGAPQQIKIDTIPPVAKIVWRPSTLQLGFACEDDRSGCKEYFWTSYVSDIAKFFPALMSKGGHNAALWCPAYKTSAGWRLQGKSEVLYNGNEVRVLCLRVEDNAGNAGVTKATIYNAYDAFAQILAAHMNS
jgi:hypothetical protein